MEATRIQLWTNQALAEDVRLRLEAELREVLPLTRTSVMCQKSYHIPGLVQIVLEAAEWVTPLKAASAFLIYHLSKFASAFEKKLAEKAAEEVWGRRAEIKKTLREGVAKPLRTVSSAIASARKASSNDTVVRIGLPIPEDYFATVLQVEGDSEEDIAVVLALFVLKAEAIEAALQDENREHGIFGGVFLRLQGDGSFVAEWMGADDKRHQIHIE